MADSTDTGPSLEEKFFKAFPKATQDDFSFEKSIKYDDRLPEISRDIESNATGSGTNLVSFTLDHDTDATTTIGVSCSGFVPSRQRFMQLLRSRGRVYSRSTTNNGDMNYHTTVLFYCKAVSKVL